MEPLYKDVGDKMPYKKEQFLPGDLIRSEWANKIEDELLSKSSFIGSFPTYLDLPNSLLLEDGSWQVVQDEKTIYVVKDKQWQKKQISIELQGDIVGTGIEHNNAVILNTTQVVAQNLVKSVQITGDVQGTSIVENGVATVYTAIPNKINSIQLTGEVNGFAQITSPDVVIQTSTNIGNVVKTDGSVPEALSGYETQRPEPGKQGRIYVQHDTRTIYYDTGTDWKAIAYQPGYITVQYTPPSGQLTISGVFYLYTEKDGNTYKVHVLNSTSNDVESQIVTVPVDVLEITSTSESLRIGFGYPYYIEQHGSNRDILGNVLMFRVPLIPANSEITIPIEKVPGFSPDKDAFFFNTEQPLFQRNSAAFDLSKIIQTRNFNSCVQLVTNHKPRYISNYVIIEKGTTNLLYPEYAKCISLLSNVQHPNVFSLNTLSAVSLAIDKPYPGHLSISVGANNYSIIQPAGYKATALNIPNSSAIPYFTSTIGSNSTFQLPQIEQGDLSTTWVPAGFVREPESLQIPNIASSLPQTGWSIEWLIAPRASTPYQPIIVVGTQLNYIQLFSSTDSSYVYIKVRTVKNGVLSETTNVKVSASLSSQPAFSGCYMKLSAYQNGVVKATLAYGSYSNTVTTSFTQPPSLSGNLYICYNPFFSDAQGSILFKNLMITNNPDHNQLQNQWQIDSSVLYFVPFEGHTLPTVVRI